MRRIIAIQALASTTLLCGCVGKTIVRPVSEAGHAPALNGIVYALPRTIVSPTVTLEMTTDRPGIYVGYVPCFFPEANPLSDVIYQRSATLRVTGVTFASRGVPDPNHVYVIDPSAGWFNKKTLDAQLTDAGLLSTSDVETTNEAAQFAISSIKTAATVVGSAISGAATYGFNISKISGESSDYQPFITCQAQLKGEIGALTDKVDSAKSKKKLSDKDRATLHAAIAKYETTLGDIQKVTGISDDQAHAERKSAAAAASTFTRALQVFTYLKNLESTRESDLARIPDGAVTSDTITALSKDYDATFQTYVGYFLGTETKDDWAPTFDVTPQKGSAGNGREFCGNNPEVPGATLFRYESSEDSTQSTGVGVCIDPVHTSEVQVPDKFQLSEADCSAKNLTEVKVVMSCKESEQIVTGEAAALNGKDHSYYYRLPATVDALVYDGTTPLGPPTSLEVAQWGIIAALPASTGGSRNKYAVTLSPVTGALTNFSMDSESRIGTLDVSPLEAGAQAIATPIATRNNKLAKLQSEEKILETQCSIDAIKKINDPSLDCSSVTSSSGTSSASP